MKLAALILAAGESRRMGFPKALLTYRGETFVDRLVGLFSPYGRPVVVLGADADRIRSLMMRAAEAEIVLNPDYLRGQMSSMQCGLRAVAPEAEAVLFTLVDHPAVEPATIGQLVRGAPPLLRIPRYSGRRGHPILIGRPLLGEFLALAGSSTARDVVHSHLEQVEHVDVEDPGIIADIDDMADYSALSGGAS